MIAAAYYLLQVVLCSGILYGYYVLALRNKVFHHWNRYYLLATVGLSLLLPWIRIPVQQEPEAPVTPTLRMLDVVATGDVYVEELGRSETLQFSAGQWALIAYVMVGLVVLAASLKALLHIRRLWLRHAHVEVEGCRFVVTRERGTPFSFMRNIFWHADISLSSEAGQRILKHELVHVREKHTHDKLFLGAILVPFWSNPFFWLIRREMAMIHEFIADRRSVDGPDGAAFAAMLLEAAYPGRSHLLANAFFHSPLKRRLKMLLSTRNTRTSYVTRVLALPLLALVVAAFTLRPASTRDVIPADPNAGVFTVVIDAGHGGHDNGVRSADGRLTEKELALAIARQIRDLNNDPSLNIVLLREKDEYQPLKEKVEKAIALKPDAFVSIHINGASEQGKGPDRSGIEVFLGTRNKRILPASAQLGSLITGSLNGLYPTLDSLRTRSKNIYVLDAPEIEYPAALVEVGYLTNPTDRAFISHPENQAAVARGILKALAGFRTIRGTQASMQLDTVPKGGTKTGQVTMKIAGDATGAEPVLVIVNGQKMDMKQLNGMTITADSAIFFKKNNGDAIKKFGAEGKNGVLVFNSAEIGKTPVEGKRIVMIETTYADSVPSSPNKKQLIVIDGKSYGEHHPSEVDALKALSPLDIATINVLGGKEAEKLYGANGERGALVIVTKKRDKDGTEKVSGERMIMRMDTTPSGQHSREVTVIGYRQPSKGGSDPLVVIDGQRIGQLSGAKLDQIIDPTRIESINVLKGESAEKLFGAEGKSGVIMITSKAAAASVSAVASKQSNQLKVITFADHSADPLGETGKIFTKVEQAAEFPGGAQVMKDFLRSRLSNDPEVKSNKKSYKGKAGIRFIVYQQGSVGAFAIDDKSGGNEKLAAKLIEYLKRGPQWEPARQNGKIVKVWHQVDFSY